MRMPLEGTSNGPIDHVSVLGPMRRMVAACGHVAVASRSGDPIEIKVDTGCQERLTGSYPRAPWLLANKEAI
jgi:hypothetical protein